MSRGHGWWGTAPLLVGAGGLLLLVFGAPSYEGSDEINAYANRQADQVEKQLNGVEPKQLPLMLQAEEEEIRETEHRSVDLRSLTKNGHEEEVAGDIPARARQRVYEAFADHRDPRTLIAGRVAFYGGIIVVFLAGILLYLRAPESNHEAW